MEKNNHPFSVLELLKILKKKKKKDSVEDAIMKITGSGRTKEK